MVPLAFLEPGTKDVNAPVGTQAGNLAPDLRYKSPDGHDIALSSLRGKIVLIDGDGIILAKNLRGEAPSVPYIRQPVNLS